MEKIFSQKAQAEAWREGKWQEKILFSHSLVDRHFSFGWWQSFNTRLLSGNGTFEKTLCLLCVRLLNLRWNNHRSSTSSHPLSYMSGAGSPNLLQLKPSCRYYFEKLFFDVNVKNTFNVNVLRYNTSRLCPNEKGQGVLWLSLPQMYGWWGWRRQCSRATGNMWAVGTTISTAGCCTWAAFTTKTAGTTWGTIWTAGCCTWAAYTIWYTVTITFRNVLEYPA